MSDSDPVLYNRVQVEQYTKQMIWLMETTEHKDGTQNGWRWDDPKNLISKKVRDFIKDNKDNEELNNWFVKKHGVSLTNYNYDTDVDYNEMSMLMDIYAIMYGHRTEKPSTKRKRK